MPGGGKHFTWDKVASLTIKGMEGRANPPAGQTAWQMLGVLVRPAHGTDLPWEKPALATGSVSRGHPSAFRGALSVRAGVQTRRLKGFHLQ